MMIKTALMITMIEVKGTIINAANAANVIEKKREINTAADIVVTETAAGNIAKSIIIKKEGDQEIVEIETGLVHHHILHIPLDQMLHDLDL